VRQRRAYKNLPHTFRLTFLLTLQELSRWIPWMNSNAYEWFYIRIQSFETAKYLSDPPATTSLHLVRAISDIGGAHLMTRRGHHWEVSVEVEWRPDALNLKPLDTTWIIGENPPAPSADWVIGRTPGNPSTDRALSGTPSNPSGIV
jgi:hypothetical protein